MVGRWCRGIATPVPPLTFITPHGFPTHRLAHLLDSLVRVSRRADGPASAGTLSGQLPCKQGAEPLIDLGTPDRRAPHLSGGLYGRARRYQPAPSADSSSGELHQPGRTLPGHPFPLHNFMHSFTRLPAVFSSFPRGTFSLSVSHWYLALDGVYHPIGAAFPNNPTLRKHPVKEWAAGLRGSHPLERYLPVYFGQAHPGSASPDYNSPAEGWRFTCWALPCSLAVTKGIPVGFFSTAY